MIWKAVFRMLRMFDAERAHGWAVRALATVPERTRRKWLGKVDLDPRLMIDILGLEFPNPIGLAAGFDKDAECFDTLLSLGFGHVEVGTVTPVAQEGNPRPRIWRFAKHKALVNAMGFPGKGADHAFQNLETDDDPEGIVGVNIGKNKDTEKALDDYLPLVRKFKDVASYITVNVSSPNTKGLRSLERASEVWELLSPLVRAASSTPVLVKFSPDMEREQLEASADAAVRSGVAGIIATNTTTDRRGLHDRGGLSGEPLKHQANEAMKILYRAVGDKTVLIGVGGISSADDVMERISAGAHLVQLYTGFVYGGPLLARKIVRDLQETLEREGLSHVHEIRGCSA